MCGRFTQYFADTRLMRATRTSFTLLLLAFVSAAGAAPKGKPPTAIGPQTVRLIESKVVMPGGADPLADYDRFYMLRTFTPTRMGPRDVVEGRFMLRRMGTHFRKGAIAVPGVSNAFTIKRGGMLPNVADGGCSVVTIFFDITTRNLIEIEQDYEGAKPELAICNGLG